MLQSNCIGSLEIHNIDINLKHNFSLELFKLIIPGKVNLKTVILSQIYIFLKETIKKRASFIFISLNGVLYNHDVFNLIALYYRQTSIK